MKVKLLLKGGRFYIICLYRRDLYLLEQEPKYFHLNSGTLNLECSDWSQAMTWTEANSGKIKT